MHPDACECTAMIDKRYEIFAATFTLLLAGALLLEALTYTRGSIYFPVGVLTIMLVMSCAWLVDAVIKLRAQPPQVRAEAGQGEQWRRFATIIALSAVYVVAVSLAGFFLSTLLIIPAMAVVIGYRNYPVIAVSALIFCAITYAIFALFLRVPLPAELWSRLFGIE